MEVLRLVVQAIVSPVVPPTVAMAIDDGLREDIKQVVDLMKNLSLNLVNGVGMVVVEKDNQISPQMVDKMVGVGDRQLHATIVVSLAISAHTVINHPDKEEICILYLHNCLTGQMIMVLRSEGMRLVLAN